MSTEHLAEVIELYPSRPHIIPPDVRARLMAQANEPCPLCPPAPESITVDSMFAAHPEYTRHAERQREINEEIGRNLLRDAD